MPFKNPDKKKEYQRGWLSKRRSDFFEGKSCAGCGSKEELQLDHVNASQKLDHRIWSWTEERRATELAKCQVLCKKCHRQKTSAQDTPRTTHGQGWMYQRYKCRCIGCRSWKKASDAKYRTKDKAS